MKKKLLIVALLCFAFGFSQFNPLAPWVAKDSMAKKQQQTIDQLAQDFNNYWEFKNKDKKGAGFKPFMRWEYHWRNKVNDQGFLITPQEMWDAWNQKNQAKLNKNNNVSLPVANWQPIGPINNATPNSTRARGRVNIVHVDPSNSNTLFMGTPAGGIWKSTNSGQSWTPLSDELPQIGVSGIAIDYSNSNVIYITTGDKDASDTYSVGVLKSIDGGLTWSTTGLSFSNTSTLAGDIVIHPTNNQILWCATNVGLYKTTNAGTSWTMVQSGNFAQGSIRLKPNDPTTIYAVSNNRFYRSINSGDSFTVITSGLPLTSGRMLLDVTPANSNYIYILSSTTSSGFQGVYRSINGGTNWTKVSGTTNILESDQAWYDLALAVSSTNENEIYTGCLNIWKSTDGGINYTKINDWSVYNTKFTHADIHYLGFFNNKLYCGSDGGIYVSSDQANTFSYIVGEAQIGQFYKISVAKQTASKVSGGLQDNGGFAYNNGIWRDYHGGDGMESLINPTNNNLIYGFLYFGQSLFMSSNSGNSLSSVASKPSAEPNGNWVTPLATSKDGEIYSGFTRLYKLNGTTWEQQSLNTIGGGNLEYIRVDPSNSDIIYVANGATLYKSTDHGLNFNSVYTASSAITSIEVNYSNSSIVYLTTAGTSGQVLKSTNGGTAFTNITSGVPNIGKNIIVHQGRNTDNPLYLGTSLGVYYLDDSMSSWAPFDANLPNVSVTDLEINLEDAKLIAGTYGRGVWQTDIPIQVPLNDVKYVNASSTTNINCQGTIFPVVEVKNNGINTLNSVTVNYTLNAASLSYTWNGALPSNGSQLIELPSATLPRGAYALNVTTTTTNDAYSDNNSGNTVVYSNDAGVVGVTNPFTNNSDALLTYTEGLTTSQWVRGTRIGGAMATGTNIAYTTNLTGNYPDLTKAYLVSQCYNLTNVVNPQISFKMKFDLEQDWDIVYVEYSTNLGASWNVLGTAGTGWYNSDRTPQTTGTDCNNCVGAQWTGTNTTLTTYTYPLNALNSESNVIFRIVFHTDEAVNQLGVNIDDFVINGVLSTENFEMQNITIYPNPSRGIFTISLGDIQPSAIEVYDVTGKVILSKKDIQTNNFETSIDLSQAKTGIYFVKIEEENQTVVKRIIKQ